MTNTNTNTTTTKTLAIYTDHGRDFNAEGMGFYPTEIKLAPISDRAKEFWKRVVGGCNLSATFEKQDGYDVIAQFMSEGMNFYTMPVYRLAID